MEHARVVLDVRAKVGDMDTKEDVVDVFVDFDKFAWGEKLRKKMKTAGLAYVGLA